MTEGAKHSETRSNIHVSLGESKSNRMVVVVVERNEEGNVGREGLYMAGKYGHVWLRFRS